jgi:hypothetical protein
MGRSKRTPAEKEAAVAAHRARIAKTKEIRARKDAPQESPSAGEGRLRPLLSRLRQRVASHRKGIVVTSAIVAGGIALTFIAKQNAQSPYCLLPHTTGSTAQFIYFGDYGIHLPETRRLAQEIEVALNRNFKVTQDLDPVMVANRNTGAQIGVAVGQEFVPAHGVTVPARDLPLKGKITMKFGDKMIAVDPDAKFTVAPDLSSIFIAGEKYDASEFKATLLGLKRDSKAGTYVLPFVNLGRVDANKCPPLKPSINL